MNGLIHVNQPCRIYLGHDFAVIGLAFFLLAEKMDHPFPGRRPQIQRRPRSIKITFKLFQERHVGKTPEIDGRSAGEKGAFQLYPHHDHRCKDQQYERQTYMHRHTPYVFVRIQTLRYQTQRDASKDERKRLCSCSSNLQNIGGLSRDKRGYTYSEIGLHGVSLCSSE